MNNHFKPINKIADNRTASAKEINRKIVILTFSNAPKSKNYLTILTLVRGTHAIVMIYA